MKSLTKFLYINVKRKKIERDALKDNIKLDLKQVRHDDVVWKFWAQDIDFVTCLCERCN